MKTESRIATAIALLEFAAEDSKANAVKVFPDSTVPVIPARPITDLIENVVKILRGQEDQV